MAGRAGWPLGGLVTRSFGWRGAVLALLALVVAAGFLYSDLPAGATGRGMMGKIRRVVAATLGLAATAGVGGASAGGPGAQAPLPPPPPTTIGINISDVHYFSSAAPFANLVLGSDWSDTQWHSLPERRQDKDGNLLSVPADGEVHRFFVVPPTGPEGFDVRCTFTGSGSLSVRAVSGPAKLGPHSLTFHVVNERGKQPFPWLVITGFNPANPLRDLDCRDARLDRATRFRPEFLQFLRGFGVIRFMDWQLANANTAVVWHDRHTPSSGRIDHDGVAIEDMMALTSELGADPWFTVPWNADDDYITRFAQMVRARLPAGRSVYVEVGNEVWNTAFSVTQQAIKEGVARGLSANPGEAGTRRYAQRTAEVMRLWEAAFAGRRGLVRVLATQQQQPWLAETALSFADTARHVDALATSAYFGTVMGGTGNTRESSLKNLETDLPIMLDAVAANRRVALAHGKRYIAYEGGVGLALPAQNDILERVQHDAVMRDIYARFLAGWERNAGDVLCLYNSVSRPNSWGMWGLAEWENEGPAEAPKLTAVRAFIAAHPEERTPARPSIAPRG